MSNMLPFVALGEMETASFEALCFLILYVLVYLPQKHIHYFKLEGYFRVYGAWN